MLFFARSKFELLGLPVCSVGASGFAGRKNEMRTKQNNKEIDIGTKDKNTSRDGKR